MKVTKVTKPAYCIELDADDFETLRFLMAHDVTIPAALRVAEEDITKVDAAKSLMSRLHNALRDAVWS